MTEPPFGGSESGPPPPVPPPPPGASYLPPPSQYPQPYPVPYPGSYADPAAPYGRHPFTGEPLSDKSKVVGGLLQLLGLLGILGIGRIYIGQTGLGVAQLLLGIGISVVTCGFGFVVPVIWGIIDTIVIMTGNARDGLGRPLRDG